MDGDGRVQPRQRSSRLGERVLLSRVLRDDWGFDGVVVSDWGAVAERVAAAEAGLDLEMPSSDGHTDRELVDAVRSGALSEAVLDRIATRVANLAAKAWARDDDVEAFDADAHHVLAREAAVQSIVLLKNEGDLLPLTAGAKIAVIGEAATEPRFQGSGSSFVNATRIDIPLEELRRIGGASAISYAPGYSNDRASATALTDEAVAAARDADVAVVFLAAPQESEGVDRDTLDLPADQLALAEAVHRANPRTVVVLARGGVVRLAPLTGIPAIVDGALLGQGVGRGVAEILYGEANPSGRLAETVPDRIEDTPAYGSFPGVHGHVLYGEGVLVGYRWYDARRIPVTFPFGHGLSYTTFEYGDLDVGLDRRGHLGDRLDHEHRSVGWT